MTDTEALLLTFGLFIIFAGPVLYWLFFWDGEQAEDALGVQKASNLTEQDIVAIEAVLDVELPQLLKRIMMDRAQCGLDRVSLFDDSSVIIETTQGYRRGVPPWPMAWVWLGDEVDACPYILNCQTYAVWQLDKGNPTAKPIQKFESVAEWEASVGQRI